MLKISDTKITLYAVFNDIFTKIFLSTAKVQCLKLERKHPQVVLYPRCHKIWRRVGKAPAHASDNRHFLQFCWFSHFMCAVFLVGFNIVCSKMNAFICRAESIKQLCSKPNIDDISKDLFRNRLNSYLSSKTAYACDRDFFSVVRNCSLAPKFVTKFCNQSRVRYYCSYSVHSYNVLYLASIILIKCVKSVTQGQYLI